MNEFKDIDRELADAFTQRPSTLSRPSLRDVKQRARRHQRQRKAGVVGACAIVGVGGVAVLATRSPSNQTTVGGGSESTICFPTPTTSVFNTLPEFNTTTTMYGLLGRYVVRAGDNPASVAAQFEVTLESLNAANANTPGYDTFQVGLEILIPDQNIVGSSTTLRPLEIGGTYTIAAGDYPGLVAQMFNVTVAELDAVNRDVPGYGAFVVGTVINIPLAGPIEATTTTNVTATAVPQTTVFPEPTAWTTTTISEGIRTVYVVQQGDTPQGVANAFDVTLLELDAINIDRPGYVEWLAGTSILIPLQDTPATTTFDPNPVEVPNCFPVSEVGPGPTTSSTTILESTTTSSTIPSFTKIGTAIQVINCSTQEGVARILSNALAAEGFTMVEPDTGTIDLPVTKVLYNPDDPVAFQVALTLSVYLGNVAVEPSGPILPSSVLGTWFPGSSVIVLLGDDLAGKTLAEIANQVVFTGSTVAPTTTTF